MVLEIMKPRLRAFVEKGILDDPIVIISGSSICLKDVFVFISKASVLSSYLTKTIKSLRGSKGK